MNGFLRSFVAAVGAAIVSAAGLSPYEFEAGVDALAEQTFGRAWTSQERVPEEGAGPSVERETVQQLPGVLV